MTRRRLILPLPLSEAERAWLRRRADARGRAGLNEEAVRWLACYRNSRSLTEAIRKLWNGASLRLRDRALTIRRVCVCADPDDGQLELEIQCAHAVGDTIIQEVPMSAAAIRRSEALLGRRLPSVLRQIVSVAPGVSLDRRHTMCVARCRYYLDPLGGVRRCLEGLGVLLSPGADAAGELLRQCWVEVAEDGLGNVVILRKDGRLCLFDHEEPLEFPMCRVQLPQLVDAYLGRPECLCDDAWLLRRRPAAPRPRMDSGDIQERVEAAVARLPLLFRIALLVRGLQRADVRVHRESLPRRWTRFADPVMEIVELGRQVAITGDPLTTARSRACAATLDRATKAYVSIPGFVNSPYSCAGLLNAVRNLVNACHLGKIGRDALRMPQRCADVRLWNVGRDEWFASTWADVSELLKLAKKESFAGDGDPVPPSFFRRPLW